MDCDSRIILSGTPIQNELNEFYAMLSFACPDLLQNVSPASFRRLYVNPIMKSREADATGIKFVFYSFFTLFLLYLLLYLIFLFIIHFICFV